MLFSEPANRKAALKGFKFAAKIFRLRLRAETITRSSGSEALDFLDSREVGQEVVSYFDLGFASGDTLSSGAAVFSKKELDFFVNSGLMLKSGDEYVDRFRNRIMFPIQDISDQVIGFTARRIGDKGPKWLDLNESKYYSKHSIVYNLNNAAPVARAKNLFIIVEGCLDVLALVRSGIGCSVAPLGTSLTELQAKFIRRYASRAILLFDPDTAGRDAALTSKKQLAKFDVRTAIAVLPEFDPDETIRRSGVRPVLEAIKSAAEAEF